MALDVIVVVVNFLYVRQSSHLNLIISIYKFQWLKGHWQIYTSKIFRIEVNSKSTHSLEKKRNIISSDYLQQFFFFFFVFLSFLSFFQVFASFWSFWAFEAFANFQSTEVFTFKIKNNVFFLFQITIFHWTRIGFKSQYKNIH